MSERKRCQVPFSLAEVPNIPGATLTVFLTDAQGKTIQESVSGQSWARLTLLPGQYKIRIQATVKGQSVEDQKVIQVKPGEIAAVQLTL